MSQSLVPDIKFSRGNNRKNKFNISSNTHTTAEVGDLVPRSVESMIDAADCLVKLMSDED